MKAAFWGIGLIVMGIFAIVMVNLFGNIAVTNQLNYTTMKNAVEASMLDAVDKAYYRSGFCICTNSDKSVEANVISFTDDNQYELLDITYDSDGKETCNSTKKCEILHGEYRLNKKTFSESLIRRFSEMVNNNKAYELVIQEVIEYPPKVSVRVNSEDDNFFPTDKESGGFTIVNQMDSIIETWSGLPSPLGAPVITCKNKTYNGNNQEIATCSNGVFTLSNNKTISISNKKTTISEKEVGSYKLTCENEDGEASEICTINSKSTPTPKPTNDTSNNNNDNNPSTCEWHYYASSVTCKPDTYYETTGLSDTSHTPKCPDGYSIRVSSCNQSGCSGYCYRYYTDTKFSPKLTSKRNSYSSKKAAVDACNKAADNWCKKQNGYSEAKSSNCKAVRDYKLSGENINGKSTSKVIENRTSQPKCSSANLKSNCTIQCLG